MGLRHYGNLPPSGSQKEPVKGSCFSEQSNDIFEGLQIIGAWMNGRSWYIRVSCRVGLVAENFSRDQQ